MSFQANITSKTSANSNFREVLFTGSKSQLVVMNLKAGEEIGEEMHNKVEQILFNLEGKGRVVLNGIETEFNPGDVVIVTPGTKHNFINTGELDLKIYTIYVPANHIDGRIHKTKTDAVSDTEDEKFGEGVEV